MKIRLIRDSGPWSEANTGKGRFIARLIPCLEELGAEIVYDTNTLVDIDMQLGYVHYYPINCKKFIIRMGPAFISTHQDYKKLNRPKKDAIKVADGVIYQSQFGKKMCDVALGPARGKTAIIFNGAPILPYSIKPFGSVLACAREWTGQKRLRQIIDAFLLADIKDSVLNIIGKTKLREKNNKVIFHGQLDDKSIAGFYANSQLVIDIGYLACCDNVVCEALANNCLVITSSESGNNELVNKDFVVTDTPWDTHPLDINKPPKIDVSVLAMKIRWALNELFMLSNKHINIKNIAKQYLAFFEEVLNG
jgi:glycosyltransferase involved in cell wall biosynthesis